MNKNLIILSAIAAAGFSGCASFQTAAVADYNRDGVVSDAEYRQYQKQKSVEASNVSVERMKRENAVDTVRDVNDTLWNVHGIRNAIRAF
ncbi:MAG: hypothetical protein RL088_4231 [Verrucomicrobiota bacterium]|jgi:hypothetical protein